MTDARKPDGDGERFADLVGAVRPIAGRNARARTRAPRAGGTAASKSDAPGRSGPADGDAPKAAQLRSSASKPVSFRFPDPTDRHRAAAPGINDRLLTALARGEPEPEEQVDLHGTRARDAQRLLARRLESAVAREIRCVLIVHGRGRGSATGEPVLRDGLPDWLTRGALASHVLAFAPAPRRLGGEGATLVLLRKSERD